MTRCLSYLLLCSALGACSQGQESVQGPGEPFRVRGAQFRSGALPGELPSDAGTTPEPDAGGPPIVTAAELANAYAYQGQAGKSMSGRASGNAASIGIALEGVGSGYWIVPTRSSDPTTGELTWNALADFDSSIPAGVHPLHFVAIGADGSAGPQTVRKYCIASAVPDNLNACDPETAPPAAVISLSWDTNADLDLHVVTPEGVVVTPKHPSTLPLDAGTDAAAYGAKGEIDRDSNANCLIDGVRRENLVFQKEAPVGVYQIYANLFDACKQPIVHFNVGVYGAQPSEDGGQSLQLYYQRGGALLDSQVDPKAALGLFVTEFEFVQ